MRFRDSLLTAFLLCATSVALAQGPLPIFEDDDPVWADEEIRSKLRAPRPIFADEPFFEDDVYVPEIDEPIIAVECTRDFPAVNVPTVDVTAEPWWKSLRQIPLPQETACSIDDGWSWPDRGHCWTARFGAVRMARSEPEGGVLFVNPAATNEAISASDFDLAHSGIEASFILHDAIPGAGRELDLELRLLQLEEDDSSLFARLNGPATEINTRPVTVVAGNFDITSTYQSRLTNLEANLRHELDNGWWTWIGGVRHINLTESLDSTFRDPVGGNPDLTYNVTTHNGMFGPQIGGQLAFYRSRRVCIDMSSKVGVLWNSADNISNGVGIPTFSIAEDRSQATYVWDLAFTGRYAVARHWSVFAGYQVLYLNGMALASDQIRQADNVNQRGSSFDSSVVYHGGSLGVEYRY